MTTMKSTAAATSSELDICQTVVWRPVIFVDPVEGGWCVKADCGEGLMFLSGARAEDQARALAQRLARAGYETMVEIRDRANTLAGVLRYSAERDLDPVQP